MQHQIIRNQTRDEHTQQKASTYGKRSDGKPSECKETKTTTGRGREVCSTFWPRERLALSVVLLLNEKKKEGNTVEKQNDYTKSAKAILGAESE
jgi:hypothetical protein